MARIKVVENVLQGNRDAAAANRAAFAAAGVLTLNLMSSPGSGKTTLLKRTLCALAPAERGVVVVGDLQTRRDAERLADAAADVVQINTGGGCHLSAEEVAAALSEVDLAGIDYLFIENVGNMVCPTAFDLGEHLRVAMLSTPEGADKAAKYPTLFQTADAVLLNKIDLVEILGYDRSLFAADLARLNSRAPVFDLAATTGAGLDPWLAWLRRRREALDPSAGTDRARLGD